MSDINLNVVFCAFSNRIARLVSRFLRRVLRVSVVVVVAGGMYAVDGIKHCVRPADMTGKSAVMLLRRIYPQLIAEANTVRTLLLFVVCSD